MLRSIFSLFILTAIAGAADLRLSVEGAAAYAVQHNPALAAARFRIEEARGRWRQAGRLANPELEAEAFRNIRSAEGSWGVAFVQKFPLTSRLRLEKAVSAAELEAVKAEVRDEERKLRGEVLAHAIKLLAQREQQALRAKQIGNSRELAEFMRARVGAGEASALESAQVQLESQQLEMELLQMEAARTALLGELQAHLGAKPNTIIEITGTLADPNRLPAARTNFKSRADYLAAQARSVAAESTVTLARAQKWEDFSVGLGAEYNRNDDAGAGIEREKSVGLKFSLPLPFWNKNEGRVEETIAAAARAKKETEALAAAIDGEAAAARAEMAVNAKVVAKLRDELIPAAIKLEDQFRANYATGQLPLREVLRARTVRLELDRQRLDALRDYHLARARHLTATTAAPVSTQKSSK